jgi:hypothetical protein
MGMQKVYHILLPPVKKEGYKELDFKEKYEICQQVKEAVQFRDYANIHDIEFCREMAEFHGCYSVKHSYRE